MTNCGYLFENCSSSPTRRCFWQFSHHFVNFLRLIVDNFSHMGVYNPKIARRHSIFTVDNPWDNLWTRGKCLFLSQFRRMYQLPEISLIKALISVWKAGLSARIFSIVW